MNLYDFHDDPKSLKHHDTAHDAVPTLIWSKFQNGLLSRNEMLQYRSVFAKKGTPAWIMTQYALAVLGPGKRFEEAEDEIAKDAYAAYSYSNNSIRGPWKKGEAAISKDPTWALQYALNIKESRWPEAEKTIATDPSSAYEYARLILKGPFPEGEKAIASDAAISYKYAEFAIKRPFPLGEKAIATNALASYRYATKVLGTRFPDGEEAIREKPHTWSQYKDFFDIED